MKDILNQYVYRIQLGLPPLLSPLSPVFFSSNLFNLPSKNPQLQRSKAQVRNDGKRKRQRKPHVATTAVDSNTFAYGTGEPCLRHAEHGTGGADAGCGDGGDAGRESMGVGVDGDVIPRRAPAGEYEVLG